MPSVENYLPERAATTYYIGEEQAPRKTGYGFHRWQQPKWLHRYVGQFFCDCMHGEGSYHWHRNYRKLPDEPHIAYEGNFYANDLEGYGHLSFTEGSSFEGLFKQNQLFGPGILTDANGKQSVGFWNDCSFVRMCEVLPGVAQVAKSACAKAKLLRFKRLLDIDEATSVIDVAVDLMTQLGAPQRVVDRCELLYNPDIRDRRSVFFNEPAFKGACCLGRPTPCDARSDILVEVDMDEPRQGSYEQDVKFVFVNNNMAEDTQSAEGLIDTVLKTEVAKQQAIAGPIVSKNPLVPIKNIKQVRATHLVAWNNEQMMMDMLLHVFLQRHHESMVAFDIKKMLSGDRQGFRPPGEPETTNRQFLEMCSYGLDLEVYEMIASNELDLNVADGRGNTALFFAVAGDHEDVIRVLLREGANINQVNDEGFTPLTMAITRYLAVLYKVDNWEFAFLPPNSQFVGTNAPVSAIKWRPRESVRGFYYEADVLAGADDDVLLQKYMVQLEKLKKKGKKRKQKKNAPPLVPPRRQFVLSLAPLPPLPPPQKEKKGKSRSSSAGSNKSKKKKKKKEEEPVEPVDPYLLDETELAKLERIEGTIRQLLLMGAEVNAGNVPLPPLALALFTKNKELAWSLLQRGARPNDRILAYGGGVTPLHVVTLMTPGEHMGQMARMLLESGANPAAVTKRTYDQPTKEFVLGERIIDIQEDVGRNPLHSLVLRADANQDKDKHLSNLLELLLQDRFSRSQRYLGHTPLALAVLRGNADLVDNLLESRLVDPNETMSGDLGTVLTVLGSKKCKKNVPLPESKRMCDSLTRYGADPLTVLTLHDGELEGNAVDLANKEAEDAMTFIKSQKKKKLKKAAKKLLMEEYKELKAVATYIGEKAAKLLQRRVQADVTQMFYNRLKEARFFERRVRPTRKPRGLKVARQWLTKDDLVRCVALLSNAGKMALTRDDAITMLTMHNSGSGRKIKMSSVEDDINTYLAPFLAPNLPTKRELTIRNRWQIRRESSLMNKVERTGSMSKAKQLTLPDVGTAETLEYVQSPFMTHPEVDDDDSKFEACFECGRRMGRLLQYCPKCKAIAFCSLKCNEDNVKRRTVHKCGVKYYGKPSYKPCERTIFGKGHYDSDDELSTSSDSESSDDGRSRPTSRSSKASKRSKASAKSRDEDVDDSEYESDASGRSKRKSKGKGSKYATSEEESDEDVFSSQRRGKKGKRTASQDSESGPLKKGKKQKKQVRDEDDSDEGVSDEDGRPGKRASRKEKARSVKKGKRDESEDEDEIEGRGKSKSKKGKKDTSDEDMDGDKKGARRGKAERVKKGKRDESEDDDEIEGRGKSKSKKAKKTTSDDEDMDGDKKGARRGKADKVKKGKRDESEDDDEIEGRGKSKSKKAKNTTSDDEDMDGDKKERRAGKVDKGKKGKRDESEEGTSRRAESKGKKVKRPTSDDEDLGGDKKGARKVKAAKEKKRGKSGDSDDSLVSKGKTKIKKNIKDKSVDGKEGAGKARKQKGEEKKATVAKEKGVKAENKKNVPRGKSKETPGKIIADSQAQKKEEEKLKFIDKYGREVTMSRIGSRGEPIKEKVKLFPEHLRVHLLQACSNLGMDLDNLMLPYTVLRDGQLYYRLYGPEPVFTENYSLI